MPQDVPPPPPEAPVVVVVASEWDMTLSMISATVQIDQPRSDAQRTVGTGFLVSTPAAGGERRILLVTANHVLDRMEAAETRIGWREPEPDGSWRFAPGLAVIRDDEGDPLWTKHPERDIAVIEVDAPSLFAEAAIPLEWLADQYTMDRWRIGPGDELMALGYPHGLSANRAGFPILRLGRVSSWPLSPIDAFPTFLMDFSVAPGNSGGPVFWTPSARRPPDAPAPDHPFVAGVLIQEVQGGGEGLDIGVVAHADYIRETIALMDRRR